MKHLAIRAENAGVARIVTLDRTEKRNAISLQMMREMIDVVKAAGEDPEVRAVILYGGISYFSAGADLHEALKVRTPDEGAAYFGQWHTLTRTLEDLPKPVIAAIEGFCITGGLELAMACDIRIAGQGATFAITSSKIGTVAGAGGTQRLPRLVGLAKALEMLFSAEPVDANEAQRIGLINRVVPAGEALREAENLVKIYAERGPLSLAFTKKAVRGGIELEISAGLKLEKQLATAIYATRDKQEGISAFIEKRRPIFRGE